MCGQGRTTAAVSSTLAHKALLFTSPTRHHFVRTSMAAAPAVHIALLGDSIFDNGTYVPGKPAVSQQLASKIAARGWKSTLLAVDGNVINDVERQLKGLPQDATHLFVSVGA